MIIKLNFDILINGNGIIKLKSLVKLIIVRDLN